MTLAAQLTAFHDALMERLSPADAAAVRAGEQALAESGIADRALRPGTPAPAFALTDQHGAVVRLSDQLRRGPVAVAFFRGGWCPFCGLTLRAYQSVLPGLIQEGATLLAISPQPAQYCGKDAECHMLGFSLLSDSGNTVADDFGVTYEIAPALRGLYKRLGHDLPKVNKTGDWRTPLPATFVIGRDGRIVVSHVVPCVHARMEPADILAAVRGLGVRDASLAVGG